MAANASINFIKLHFSNSIYFVCSRYHIFLQNHTKNRNCLNELMGPRSNSVSSYIPPSFIKYKPFPTVSNASSLASLRYSPFPHHFILAFELANSPNQNKSFISNAGKTAYVRKRNQMQLTAVKIHLNFHVVSSLRFFKKFCF